MSIDTLGSQDKRRVFRHLTKVEKPKILLMQETIERENSLVGQLKRLLKG